MGEIRDRIMEKWDEDARQTRKRWDRLQQDARIARAYELALDEIIDDCASEMQEHCELEELDARVVKCACRREAFRRALSRSEEA